MAASTEKAEGPVDLHERVNPTCEAGALSGRGEHAVDVARELAAGACFRPESWAGCEYRPAFPN